MLSEGQKDREKRFKAMLQYLILREACEFKSCNEVADKVEEEARYASESAEKILSAMESKFFDLFVEDDLVENYLFFEVPGKQKAHNKKHDFKNLIQQQISDKIIVINSADKDNSNYKESLKKIVQSPIIENSIMTQDFIDDSKSGNFTTNSDSGNINLIENIGKIFALSNSNPNDQKLITKTNLYLIEKENDFCQISENSIAIQAHLNTATSLSLGFLNLTGKIITKALGDLSGGLFQTDTNGKGKIQVDNTSPSESVRGERITKILDLLSPSKSVLGNRISETLASPQLFQTQDYV